MLRLLLVLVISCGGVSCPGAEGGVRLRVQGLPNSVDTSPANLANWRVVEAFEKRHPNIRLVAAEGLQIEGIVPEAVTIMAIAGGVAPDVLALNFRSMDSFVRQGMVAPLEEFLKREPDGGEAILNRILPQVRGVVERRGPDGAQRIYGLPNALMVRGVYFNRERFRASGLPERAPADWEELLEFSRKLKEANAGYPGFLLDSGQTASWDLIGFLWSAGGEAVEEVAPDQWRATFDSHAAVLAYLFYYRIVEAERLAIRAKMNVLSRQEKERIGMRFGYLGDASGMNPDLWGFGAMPKGPAGLHGSELNAKILSVYSGIADPGTRMAAWEYVRFVTSEEAERIRTETFIELGQVHLVSPITLRKFGYERYLALMPPELEQALITAYQDGKPEPNGYNCNLVYSEMTYPIDQILLSREVRAAWDAGDRKELEALVQTTLDRAVAKTNERMIGYVSPENLSLRRKVASVVVVLIIASFTWIGWYVSRIFSRSAAMLNRPVNGRTIIPWLCLAPALLLIFVWQYVPVARGTVMAFLDYHIVLKSTFVGLDNFANVLFDRTFWNGMLATVHFALWTLTLGFATPILLAYGLHLIPKHKIFFRVLYYLPAVISSTAVFFLWRELFGLEGIMNQLIRMLGFEGRRAWTEDPYLAMLTCVIPGVWAGAGPGCLIYLAALKTIPGEQFEAAEIDGAGFWQKTRLIVLPSLKALIFINFIGAVSAAFHGATNILIMTGGGPNGITEVASLLIFFEAFTRLRFGPATAMAWILGSMLVGFTVIQLKRLSQMEFKTAK